jgi:hypothetical protein
VRVLNLPFSPKPKPKGGSQPSIFKDGIVRKYHSFSQKLNLKSEYVKNTQPIFFINLLKKKISPQESPH